jgi:hypothetical protein
MKLFLALLLILAGAVPSLANYDLAGTLIKGNQDCTGYALIELPEVASEFSKVTKQYCVSSKGDPKVVSDLSDLTNRMVVLTGYFNEGAYFATSANALQCKNNCGPCNHPLQECVPEYHQNRCDLVCIKYQW